MPRETAARRSSHDVVAPPFGSGRHRLPGCEYDVVIKRERFTGLAWTLKGNVSGCLQVKQQSMGAPPKAAKGMTTEEFAFHLQKMAEIVHARWDYSLCAYRPTWAFDNPNFHKLSRAQLTMCNIGRNNVQRPPRYSGDFMQCIEHVHGFVCMAFKKENFQTGREAYNMEVHGAKLRALFLRMVTPNGVLRDCRNVMALVKHISDANDGGYAPPNMC